MGRVVAGSRYLFIYAVASTVIVVLGVAYLGVLLRQGDAIEKGLTGLGTAAVIAALAYYIRGHRRD